MTTNHPTSETGVLERCALCQRIGPVVLDPVEDPRAVVWMKVVEAWVCMSCLDDWVGIFESKHKEA